MEKEGGTSKGQNLTAGGGQDLCGCAVFAILDLPRIRGGSLATVSGPGGEHQRRIVLQPGVGTTPGPDPQHPSTPKAVVAVVVPGHNTFGVDGPRWRWFLGLCQPQAARRNAVGVGAISIFLFPITPEDEDDCK